MNKYCAKASSLDEPQSSHCQRITALPTEMNDAKCFRYNVTKMQEDFL